MFAAWPSAHHRRESLDQAERLQAVAALRADDDVVVDGDFHVLAGLDQIAGQADVLGAGGGIAARVIVDDDQAVAPSAIARLMTSRT